MTEVNLLPTEVKKGNPYVIRKLIIISPTKVGKTELVSKLPNNLLIDLENGSEHVDGLIIDIKAETVKINSQRKKDGKNPITRLDTLNIVASQIRDKNLENGSPVYDYITLDTTSELEDLAVDLANLMYKRSLIGKSFTGKNIINELPKGGGYGWLRDAFEMIYKEFEMLPKKCLILLGHVKKSSINKDGKDMSAQDLDLTGKLKRIVCADADAIGFMYRSKDNLNQNILSFKTNPYDLATGSRAKHLANQEFVISEMTDKGLVTHWDKIFID